MFTYCAPPKRFESAGEVVEKVMSKAGCSNVPPKHTKRPTGSFYNTPISPIHPRTSTIGNNTHTFHHPTYFPPFTQVSSPTTKATPTLTSTFMSPNVSFVADSPAYLPPSSQPSSHTGSSSFLPPFSPFPPLPSQVAGDDGNGNSAAVTATVTGTAAVAASNSSIRSSPRSVSAVPSVLSLASHTLMKQTRVSSATI